MKSILAVVFLGVGFVSGPGLDLSLDESDLGLNSYNPAELIGCFKESPKNLPKLGVDAILAWLKASVKLEPEQLPKIEGVKGKIKERAERFKKFVAGLESYSVKFDHVTNDRERTRLQQEAKEFNEQFHREFSMPTASIAYNPLKDLRSFLRPILTDEQNAVWESELLQRFEHVASRITIERVNQEALAGKLFARKSDYDFERKQAVNSYLVRVGEKTIYVAPAEVARTPDHRECVQITLTEQKPSR